MLGSSLAAAADFYRAKTYTGLMQGFRSTLGTIGVSLFPQRCWKDQNEKDGKKRCGANLHPIYAGDALEGPPLTFTGFGRYGTDWERYATSSSRWSCPTTYAFVCLGQLHLNQAFHTDNATRHRPPVNPHLRRAPRTHHTRNRVPNCPHRHLPPLSLLRAERNVPRPRLISKQALRERYARRIEHAEKRRDVRCHHRRNRLAIRRRGTGRVEEKIGDMTVRTKRCDCCGGQSEDGVPFEQF